MSAVVLVGGNVLGSGGLVFAVGSGPPGSGILIFLFPQTMPDMGVTVPVLFTINVVGGSGTYPTFSATGLPPGLTFASDGANGGLLQGTPTTPGTFSPTFSVSDSLGNFGNEVFTCTVS